MDKWEQLLEQAVMNAGAIANPEIRVVRRDEALAILRNALRATASETSTPIAFCPGCEKEWTPVSAQHLLDDVIEECASVAVCANACGQKECPFCSIAAEIRAVKAIYEARATPSAIATKNAAPQEAEPGSAPAVTGSGTCKAPAVAAPDDKSRIPTPRTDAHLRHLNLPDGRKVGIPNETVEMMRQLEIELDGLRAMYRAACALAEEATPVSATLPKMIHACWRYRNLKTGEETLTHQPPDRVLFPDDYEIIELFAKQPEYVQRSPYWLIERGSPCEWWVSGSGRGDGTMTREEWTTDASKAQKFNEWGANQHAKELEAWGVKGPLRVTEHLDLPEPPDDKRGFWSESVRRDDVLAIILQTVEPEFNGLISSLQERLKELPAVKHSFDIHGEKIP